jgi:hypothetical protein
MLVCQYFKTYHLLAIATDLLQCLACQEQYKRLEVINKGIIYGIYLTGNIETSTGIYSRMTSK